jgi:hypothetical protein
MLPDTIVSCGGTAARHELLSSGRYPKAATLCSHIESHNRGCHITGQGLMTRTLNGEYPFEISPSTCPPHNWGRNCLPCYWRRHQYSPPFVILISTSQAHGPLSARPSLPTYVGLLLQICGVASNRRVNSLAAGCSSGQGGPAKNTPDAIQKRRRKHVAAAQPRSCCGKNGWGGRIRTSEWRDQNPLPYHLATPQETRRRPRSRTRRLRETLHDPHAPFRWQCRGNPVGNDTGPRRHEHAGPCACQPRTQRRKPVEYSRHFRIT